MKYLKERIKHAVRFRHKRGYGVHSPFMFHLILNVIRDKENRFTYPESLEKASVLKNREKKVYRLLSRLIRHLKVEQMYCFGIYADLLAEYLSQVYPTAVIRSNFPEKLEGADFVYVGRKAGDFLSEESLTMAFRQKRIKYMVIADIYKTSFHARLWRMYREQATVTVDMMWYGLLVFDEKVQRGKYNLII